MLCSTEHEIPMGILNGAALLDDWYKRLDNYWMCYTTILAGQDSSNFCDISRDRDPPRRI